MATNKKKPINKKLQNKKVVKPVAKKSTVVSNTKKVNNNKKVIATKKPATKPVVKTAVAPKEVQIDKVSIAEQIPASISTCACGTKCKCKKSKTTYIVAGVIIVALLLAIIF